MTTLSMQYSICSIKYQMGIEHRKLNQQQQYQSTFHASKGLHLTAGSFLGQSTPAGPAIIHRKRFVTWQVLWVGGWTESRGKMRKYLKSVYNQSFSNVVYHPCQFECFLSLAEDISLCPDFLLLASFESYLQISLMI